MINAKMFPKLIEISKALAPKYRQQRCFHTTFILHRNKIISIGINRNKTTPKNLKYNYKYPNGMGTHSEMNAVIKLGSEDCSDFVFVNIRIDRNGEPNTSHPCEGCINLLNAVGYREVWYINDNLEFQQL